MTAQISQVAVVGAGYMGGGIAQVLAMAGFRTSSSSTPTPRPPGATSSGCAGRPRTSRTRASSTRVGRPGARPTSGPPTAWPEAVAEADFDRGGRLREPGGQGPGAGRSIEAAARPDAIIGSNTSTLPIGGLAVNLQHAERFLGVHFSNPAPFIPGVELIAHAGTDEAAVVAVEALVARTGKLSARVNDKAGLRAQPPAVRAAQGGHHPRRGGRGDRRGRRHRRPHHLRLPAAVLRPVRHRRHGRARRLRGRLPHPRASTTASGSRPRRCSPSSSRAVTSG